MDYFWDNISFKCYVSLGMVAIIAIVSVHDSSRTSSNIFLHAASSVDVLGSYTSADQSQGVAPK
jgi:hypothetical protein